MSSWNSFKIIYTVWILAPLGLATTYQVTQGGGLEQRLAELAQESQLHQPACAAFAERSKSSGASALTYPGLPKSTQQARALILSQPSGLQDSPSIARLYSCDVIAYSDAWESQISSGRKLEPNAKENLTRQMLSRLKEDLHPPALLTELQIYLKQIDRLVAAGWIIEDAPGQQDRLKIARELEASKTQLLKTGASYTRELKLGEPLRRKISELISRFRA